MKLSTKSQALIKALVAVGYTSEDDAEIVQDSILEGGPPAKLDLTKLDAAALFYDGQWVILSLE